MNLFYNSLSHGRVTLITSLLMLGSPCFFKKVQSIFLFSHLKSVCNLGTMLKEVNEVSLVMILLNINIRVFLQY